MLFVALCRVKAGTRRERASRRLQWQYPEGAKLVAEYWLQAEDPNVISVFETDSSAAIMAALGAWDDVFDISVLPAVTAEEGMQIAKQMMQGS
ncbi:MAG: DUF3303 family protein [Bacteroidetes bacterium]|nr:DUF3303 family protein [Bacteroidota bacterium]MCL5026889.1 DUF3303 family protein [Chloroflexota bacterium]